MKCPICNESKNKRLGKKNSFEIIKCKNCLTIYSKKTEASIKYFDYSNYYSEENLTVPDFISELYRKIIREFESHRVNDRFLDIGCGAGILLDIARELDWNVTGVEVSKPAAEYLRKRGLNIIEGTLEEANFPDDYFDVITCTEVIEHVTNPKEVLKEIARILNPKGILWMTTPHSSGLAGKLLGSKWSVVAPPEHLNLFSIKSLRMCLEEAGFKNCRIVSNGFNPFEFYQALKEVSDLSAEKPLSTANKEEKEKIAKMEFNRGEQKYQLNRWFVGGESKQRIKNLLNFIINKTNSGDTIKVWATLE